MKIRPIKDNLVVRIEEAKGMTPGGIALPDVAMDKPQRGEVIAVGSGSRSDDGVIHPMEVKVGDIVLFKQYDVTLIEVDGEELGVMCENSVLVILE